MPVAQLINFQVNPTTVRFSDIIVVKKHKVNKSKSIVPVGKLKCLVAENKIIIETAFSVEN